MPDAADAARADPDHAAERIWVTVAYAATARDVQQVQLDLPPQATVGDALMAPGLAELCPDFERSRLAISVWGQRADALRRLQPGDRVELCRPLLVDPKTARRERFARQGARAAGLFSSKDSGR